MVLLMLSEQVWEPSIHPQWPNTQTHAHSLTQTHMHTHILTKRGTLMSQHLLWLCVITNCSISLYIFYIYGILVYCYYFGYLFHWIIDFMTQFWAIACSLKNSFNEKKKKSSFMKVENRDSCCNSLMKGNVSVLGP